MEDAEVEDKKSDGPVLPMRRGAVKHKGHWYKFMPEKMSWHHAKAKCEEMGGHLLTITDAEEETFIGRLVANSNMPFQGKDGIWLGATDQGQEGRWVWVDGKPVAYSNWHGNQPNNKNNEEHYMMLWISAGAWVDQPSISKQHDVYYICEWDE